VTTRSTPLVDVLTRCREFCKASHDAAWSTRSIAEIAGVLDRAIEASERGTKLNYDELKVLFAPTGDLQETAIANGWAEEYLLLSARFDDLIG
jgi:hypothetical protein